MLTLRDDGGCPDRGLHATGEPGLFECRFRRGAHDLHGLQTDGDDPQEEVERIARIVHRLDRVAIGVAGIPAGLDGPDTLVFRDPHECGLVIDDVLPWGIVSPPLTLTCGASLIVSYKQRSTTC